MGVIFGFGYGKGADNGGAEHAAGHDGGQRQEEGLKTKQS